MECTNLIAKKIPNWFQNILIESSIKIDSHIFIFFLSIMIAGFPGQFRQQFNRETHTLSTHQGVIHTCSSAY